MLTIRKWPKYLIVLNFVNSDITINKIAKVLVTLISWASLWCFLCFFFSPLLDTKHFITHCYDLMTAFGGCLMTCSSETDNSCRTVVAVGYKLFCYKLWIIKCFALGRMKSFSSLEEETYFRWFNSPKWLKDMLINECVIVGKKKKPENFCRPLKWAFCRKAPIESGIHDWLKPCKFHILTEHIVYETRILQWCSGSCIFENAVRSLTHTAVSVSY